mgnify:CR=1 FL=1
MTDPQCIIICLHFLFAFQMEPKMYKKYFQTYGLRPKISEGDSACYAEIPW